MGFRHTLAPDLVEIPPFFEPGIGLNADVHLDALANDLTKISVVSKRCGQQFGLCWLNFELWIMEGDHPIDLRNQNVTIPVVTELLGLTALELAVNWLDGDVALFGEFLSGDQQENSLVFGSGIAEPPNVFCR